MYRWFTYKKNVIFHGYDKYPDGKVFCFFNVFLRVRVSFFTFAQVLERLTQSNNEWLGPVSSNMLLMRTFAINGGLELGKSTLNYWVVDGYVLSVEFNGLH